MSDYGDYSDYSSDHEWMYVEDHYDEASVDMLILVSQDDLAEHTCHSPTLDAQVDLQLNSHDYDPYDYWEDLAYLSDSYFDGRTAIGESQDGEKRKATLAPKVRNARRRRLSGNRSSKNGTVAPQTIKSSVPDPIVVWKSNNERDSITNAAPPAEELHYQPVALLKDWKERFKIITGLPRVPTSDTEIPTISGEGFDLGDLQSVAGLLSSDSIDALQEILREKGLDSEAVQIVLQDLIAGKEPTFDDEEEASDEKGDENSILVESDDHILMAHLNITQPSLPQVFRPAFVEDEEGSGNVATHHESLESNGANGVNTAAMYNGTSNKRKTPEDNVDSNRALSSTAGKRPRGSFETAGLTYASEAPASKLDSASELQMRKRK